MAKKKVAKNQQVKLIPLKFRIPDSIITRFVTNLTVQLIGNEFKVSFYEQSLPIRLDKTEPPPDEVEAICVASVIITADRLPGFIETLQAQLNKYNARKKPNK